MNRHPDAPFTIRLIRMPAWAVPIVIVLLVVLVGVVALVSLSLLLVLIPLVLVAGIAQRLLGRRKEAPVTYSRSAGARSGNRTENVIDADYEVLDAPSKPKV